MNNNEQIKQLEIERDYWMNRYKKFRMDFEFYYGFICLFATIYFCEYLIVNVITPYLIGGK